MTTDITELALIAKIKKQLKNFDTVVLKEGEALELIEALEKAQQSNTTQREYYDGVIADGGKRIAELEVARQCIADLETENNRQVLEVVRLSSLVVELESRTVTIKFAPIPVEELGNVRDGKKHPYMFGAGYNSAVIHCESVIQQELDAKGIKWEAE